MSLGIDVRIRPMPDDDVQVHVVATVWDSDYGSLGRGQPRRPAILQVAAKVVPRIRAAKHKQAMERAARVLGFDVGPVPDPPAPFDQEADGGALDP